MMHPDYSAGRMHARLNALLRCEVCRPPPQLSLLDCSLCRVACTTGTGTSGEMRDTSPQMYLSSTMSPTTANRRRDHRCPICIRMKLFDHCNCPFASPDHALESARWLTCTL